MTVASPYEDLRPEGPRKVDLMIIVQCVCVPVCLLSFIEVAVQVVMTEEFLAAVLTCHLCGALCFFITEHCRYD